jgi:hypothetical protein
MKPTYDLDKIKYSTDARTFTRAVQLHNSGKITNFRSDPYGFSAIVQGTQPYEVYVSARSINDGNCTCYLGQNDVLCKHMIATALRAVSGGNALSEEQATVRSKPTCNGRIGDLDESELKETKAAVTSAMRYIKPYVGPSRTWFMYQASLSEGCGRLTAIVSELPVCDHAAQILVDILLRLDRKLCSSGVDDSDGTVGDFIIDLVSVLIDFVKIDPSTARAFQKVLGKRTCFEWEEPLVKYLDIQSTKKQA